MKPIVKFIFCLSIVFLLAGCNSKNDFQVTEWNSNSDKPIIFISVGIPDLIRLRKTWEKIFTPSDMMYLP